MSAAPAADAEAGAAPAPAPAASAAQAATESPPTSAPAAPAAEPPSVAPAAATPPPEPARAPGGAGEPRGGARAEGPGAGEPEGEASSPGGVAAPRAAGEEEAATAEGEMPDGEENGGGEGSGAEEVRELHGLRLGDAVRDAELGLLGFVQALHPPASASVEFPGIETEVKVVPTARLRVFGRAGLRLGQDVAWRREDSDVPRGSVGVLAAYQEGGVAVVRFGSRCFAFSQEELLDAGPHGSFRAGDRVRWLSADADVPEGSVGVVLGFKAACESVLFVEFLGRSFGFLAEQLEALEPRAEAAAAAEHEQLEEKLRAMCGRPPCYPFDEDLTIEYEGQAVRVAVSDAERLATISGIVVFCPGTHGGVGPCRTPGTNHDRDALFPTLSKALQAEGILSCRVCWAAMHPPLEEAVRAAVGAALHGLQRAKDLGPLPGRGKVGVCLVGHSLGGAVALAAAGLLARLLPEMNSRGEGPSQGQELLGVCTLAAQESGSLEAVKLLGGDVRKLFLHGSSDAVLPWHSAERIHAAACEPKEFCVLPGGEHDLYAYRAYLLGRVRTFLLDVLGHPRSETTQHMRRRRTRSGSGGHRRGPWPGAGGARRGAQGRRPVWGVKPGLASQNAGP